MSSFATIRQEEIRTDCRFYSGYKPCGKADFCPGCTHFEPRGTEILVIKLGAMGDVLRSKSILPGLKKKYPQSWIIWLTEKGSEALARDPLVDEIRTLTAEGLLALEGRRYDVLICLDKDAPAVALAGKLDAKDRFGFAPTAHNTISVWNERAMEALRLGLSDELKYRINRKTMPQIVCDAAEVVYTGEPYGLQLSPEADRAARAHLASILRGHPGPYVGLNTGCGPVFQTKGWTAENMEAFLRKTEKEFPGTIVLLGGPRERALHQRLCAAAPHVADAGTSHPLEVFFGLVNACDAIMTADSLALHVAIALRKPVLAWFGPTAEQEIDLFGRGEKILTDFSCAPCYLKVCPKPVTCMEAMSAEVVYTRLLRLLESQGLLAGLRSP